eukprot:CAMPEP_0195286960 /NCGR_PEP_ID=MMETSP0707-20130614/4217_1 /TAXON_ID=33640 /ORGANISM="Asterionellopsis glacialis, Strain CCMP134" /LENGTH=561 /DNA_ID=CAMNT_0040346665 /DNA_START=186 /DNA_END=1868 /DNA_ORIENTATION=-
MSPYTEERPALPIHAAADLPRSYRNVYPVKSKFMIIWLPCLALFAIATGSFGSSTSYFRRSDISAKERPVIYTFFQLRTDVSAKNAGSEHTDMIDAWKRSWTEAGWDPRILSLEDAKNHPDYEKYAVSISNTDNAHEGSYDFMCFVRWLAMASHGKGGFMSDYDTFPLGLQATHALPNDGKFTSFQRHVPALISGSAPEWERMAKAVMEMAISHQKDDFYSDMLALNDIYNADETSYLQEELVVALPYKSHGVVDCDSSKNALAAHLSHSDTHKAIEGNLVEDKERSVLAFELIQDWNKQCGVLNTEGAPKPVMHTFFTQRTDVGGDPQEHQKLLDAWKTLWSEAGWETQVLTIEHAQQHPKFEQYSQMVQQVPNAKYGSFDYMNFMKWLAMSSTGQGGWLSDYDTFPIGLPATPVLPNDGQFTSFERHVPSLLSGNAEEWDRITAHVMDFAANKGQQVEYYSDMLALFDLYEKDDKAYIQYLQVTGFPYKDNQYGQVDCDVAKENHAIHLSNSVITRAMNDGMIQTNDRSVLAYELIQNWRNQCNTNSINDNINMDPSQA